MFTDTLFLNTLTAFLVSSNLFFCVWIFVFISAVHGELALMKATSICINTAKYILAVFICSAVAYGATWDFCTASSTAKQFVGTDGVVAALFILLPGVVVVSSSSSASLLSAAFRFSTVFSASLRFSSSSFCLLSRLLAVCAGSSVVVGCADVDVGPSDVPVDCDAEVPPEVPDDWDDELPPDVADDLDAEVPPEVPDDCDNELPSDVPDDWDAEVPPEELDDWGTEVPPEVPDDWVSEVPPEVSDDWDVEVPPEVPDD